MFGLGVKLEFDPELVIPNPRLSIDQGAIAPWVKSTGEGYSWYAAMLTALAEQGGFTIDQPFNTISPAMQETLLYGKNAGEVTVKYRNKYGRERSYKTPFEGVLPSLQRHFDRSSSDYVREELSKYQAARPCPACNGNRLRKESLAVLVERQEHRRCHAPADPDRRSLGEAIGG